MSDLPHEIVTCIGTTGSGKTRLLTTRLAPRHRRRISIDLVGEYRALYPHAYQAIGLPKVLRALHAWARAEATSWHMIAVLREDEIASLMWTLCPIFDGVKLSLAELLGGVCIEVSELDVLLPVNGGGNLAKSMKNAYQRGRHVGLSLLGATQRPSLCSRVATSQSDAVITFRMHEPLDVQYMRGISPVLADEARTLGKYWSAWYFKDSGRVAVRDPDYRVVREFDPSAERTA